MLNRRNFLALASAAGAFSLSGSATGKGPAIVSSRSPNGRLRLGAIGCGGIARGEDIPGLASHKRIEMAAFCDVDTAQMASLRVKFPKARFYQHYADLLAKEDLDAVLVATTDHTHCEIMSEVLKRGLNLYGQKPLCRSFAENRRLERLAADAGVVTQLGAQVTPWSCDRETVALIASGKIGRIEKVWTFSNSGYYAKMLPRKWPLKSAPVPETLDWKAWLASAPYRDYVPKTYAHFTWRAFRDFGSGWLGDMGTHLMLPVWMGMDLGQTVPLSAKASVYDCGWNAEMKRQYLPLYTHVTWKFPGVKATGNQPFEVEWCDGPRDGSLPKEFIPEGKVAEIEANKIDMRIPDEYLPPKEFLKLGEESVLGKLPLQGRVIKGEDGWIISTHYNMPPVMLDKDGKRRPLWIPHVAPVQSHYHEFVDCCLDGGKTSTDFSLSCKVTDWLLLGRKAIENPGQTVTIG